MIKKFFRFLLLIALFNAALFATQKSVVKRTAKIGTEIIEKNFNELQDSIRLKEWFRGDNTIENMACSNR